MLLVAAATCAAVLGWLGEGDLDRSLDPVRGAARGAWELFAGER